MMEKINCSRPAATHNRMASGINTMVTRQTQPMMTAIQTVILKLNAVAAALRTSGLRSRKMSHMASGPTKLNHPALRTRAIKGRSEERRVGKEGRGRRQGASGKKG